MAPTKALVVRDREYVAVLDDVAALLVASRSTAPLPRAARDCADSVCRIGAPWKSADRVCGIGGEGRQGAPAAVVALRSALWCEGPARANQIVQMLSG